MTTFFLFFYYLILCCTLYTINHQTSTHKSCWPTRQDFKNLWHIKICLNFYSFKFSSPFSIKHFIRDSHIKKIKNFQFYRNNIFNVLKRNIIMAAPLIGFPENCHQSALTHSICLYLYLSRNTYEIYNIIPFSITSLCLHNLVSLNQAHLHTLIHHPIEYYYNFLLSCNDCVWKK